MPGTEWQEVTCTDGRRYYYHTTTSETSWKVPPEVTAARNRPPPLDPGKAAMLARAVAMGAEAAPEYQGGECSWLRGGSCLDHVPRLGLGVTTAYGHEAPLPAVWCYGSPSHIH